LSWTEEGKSVKSRKKASELFLNIVQSLMAPMKKLRLRSGFTYFPVEKKSESGIEKRNGKRTTNTPGGKAALGLAGAKSQKKKKNTGVDFGGRKPVGGNAKKKVQKRWGMRGGEAGGGASS